MKKPVDWNKLTDSFINWLDDFDSWRKIMAIRLSSLVFIATALMICIFAVCFVLWYFG